MKLKTLNNGDINGKKILLRVDFNVPIDKKTGKITDDSRLKMAVPTIKMLIKQGAKVIVMSHLGRPEGKKDPKFKLDPVGKQLAKLLKQNVTLTDDCFGEKVESIVKKMKNGEVILLENLRFYHQEEDNDLAFARKLAKLGDIFISDAFGVAHRAHASVSAITKYLPSYAGPLLNKEYTILKEVMEKPKKPLCVIIGGAKIDTKIDLIKEFLRKADYILIGGALANTFLAAAGYDIGKSLFEKDKIEIAQEIMLLAEKYETHFVLPKDVIVASEISETSETLDMPIQDVESDMKILDIGPVTRTRFHQIIQKSNTILWNGPLGMHEHKPFQNGTKMIAQELANSKAITIIGGGDTLDAIGRFQIPWNSFTHVSSGGGAMLEFLGGKKLPGIECLYANNRQ